MKLVIKLDMDCMDRVDIFGKRSDLTLTTKLTGLFTTVGTHLTTLRNWGEEQVSGGQDLSAGVQQRLGLAKDIRFSLRDISDIAKSMEEEGEAGMAELFRYPRYSSYESLLLTAEAFADRALLQVADFTDRGLPATFVTDLQAKITAFRAATAVKVGGKANRTAGTAGLEAAAAAGMKVVRTLRPLMRVHLKANAALLAAWNLAARVERAPRSSGSGGSGGSSGSGGSTPPPVVDPPVGS
jgi:hypothetical protein